MTVIRKEHWASLLAASRNVYVTMLSPTWKKEPEVRVWKVSKLPELSNTTGSVQVTVVPVLRKGTTVVMSAGQEVIWGGTVSPRGKR